MPQEENIEGKQNVRWEAEKNLSSIPGNRQCLTGHGDGSGAGERIWRGYTEKMDKVGRFENCLGNNIRKA